MELFKRLRPRTWDGLVGSNQQAQAEMLKKVIASGKIPTLFLFSGPFGTGKTTMAKLVAKAINCTTPPEPGGICDQCDNCRLIESENGSGFVFFSAASAGGAESVRELLSQASFSHSIIRRVAIIDEFQALSEMAQNALLVPFDNEQFNATFIACTSNHERIQGSLISRANHVHLRPLSERELEGYGVQVAQSQGYAINAMAMRLLVLESGGSPRTLLSRMEQFAESGYDERLLKPDWSITLLDTLSYGGVEALQNGMRIAQEVYHSEADGQNVLSRIAVMLAERLTDPGERPNWYARLEQTLGRARVRALVLTAAKLSTDMATRKKRVDVALAELILSLTQ